MRSSSAFTLVELLVLVVILFIGIAILLPSRSSHCSVSYRTMCASNLSGMYKSMYTYSITNRDRFYVAGEADSSAMAIGFQERERLPNAKPPVLSNNVTASLWSMVRDGSNATKGFICPSSGDVPDPLTLRSDGTKAAFYRDTYDFLERRNLSYSPINMYHVGASRFWGSTAPPDYVLMGDHNGTDHPQRHTLSKTDGAKAKEIEARENSPNHGGEGQNLVFGDGHVVYHRDPFQGRGGDNVYAMTIDDMNRPPTLGNDDGDAAGERSAVRDADSWLLPLSGNGGASLSGLPNTINGIRGDPPRDDYLRRVLLGGLAGLMVAIVIAQVLTKRKTTPQVQVAGGQRPPD